MCVIVSPLPPLKRFALCHSPLVRAHHTSILPAPGPCLPPQCLKDALLVLVGAGLVADGGDGSKDNNDDDDDPAG
jgi:hypothetical protein